MNSAIAFEADTTTEPVAVYTKAAGGVVRTRNLIRAGYSRYRIDRAIAQGSLTRVRKGWVAVPGADAYLVAAARAGVVVSCITEARRLGLWVLDEDRPHVAAPAHSGCVSPRDATVHWAKPLVPRHPDALVDPIENVLVLVAMCQPFEAALAVWESALRQALVERDALERMPLPTAARNVLERSLPFSDSGLESFVVPRLGWMRIPLVPQVWIAGHRVDFLIGERLVLQIDGGHHVGEQRESDIDHDAQLMLLGYHVIRVGYGQIVERWHTVQDRLVRAVAQGLHHAR
ncbi:type IV toxin-antitoxin system AbiEi family antitoxin domain-containing protein [Agromyces italicus]|uniref:type IV toxin-antitoxin system AbiEi family antitoxin domain-containing protein n=1 Tax=Agromyces italicus TaxID=279572 RepID=UPI0003B7860A|nr:type IV toxin-antitoxin system AbiEi family antitoxin domain-containing protein [Agromyces italicus]